MGNIVVRDIARNLDKKFTGKQDALVSYAALMGRGDGSDPRVSGMEGYVWVRVGHDQAVQMAYNVRIMPRDDLAVYIGYLPEQPNLLQVIAIRQEAYVQTGQGTIPQVIDHHETHEYGGGDDVFVEWRRIMGFRVGRPNAFFVFVDPGVMHRNGLWHWFPEQYVDLTTHVPGAGALYVLIYLDADGIVQHTVGAAASSILTLTLEDCPVESVGEFPLAAVRLYFGQTEIGDTPTNPDIVDLRFPQSRQAADNTHELLSATHDDTLAAAVVDGDIVIGNITPKWSRLAISVPAATVRNVLGVDNAELRPSWKAALDANNPTTIGIGDAAAPGTSLIFSHRDHQHASPATWTATAHNLLSATHGDTVAGAVARGDLVVGVAGPSWDNLALGGAAGSFLTRDANDVAWSTFYLTGTPLSTYDLDAMGGVPGGNDTNVQWNNAGAFAGSDLLCWTGGTTLAVGGAGGTEIMVYGLGVGIAPTSTRPLRVSIVNANDIALELCNADTPHTAYLSVFGSAGSGNYWAGLDSANTVSIYADCPLIIRATDDIIFSGSAAAEHARLDSAGNFSIQGLWTNCLVKTDGSKVLTSIGDANGYLHSNGAGTYTWDAGTTAPHDILSVTHSDTLAAAVVRGDIVYGNSTPAWARLAKGSALAVLTGDGTDTAWSTYLISGTAGGKTTLAITNTKTLTLTCADDYNLTIPATGTAALLGTANIFTANQTISNTAPSLALTDTTGAAKSLTIVVDANVADFRESAGALGSLLALDLANNRVGIGTAAPAAIVDISGASVLPRVTDTDTAGSAGFQVYETTTVKAGFVLRGSTYGTAERQNAFEILSYAGDINFYANSVRKLSLKVTGNLKLAGIALRATTEGTNHLDIFDGTAPVGTLANGISIYSAAGECWIMDAGGNATQQTPHNECGEWIFYSRNTVTGKVLKIDMERMLKAINKQLRFDFIHEYIETP